MDLYKEYAIDIKGPNMVLVNDESSREVAERIAARFPGGTLKCRFVSDWVAVGDDLSEPLINILEEERP